MKKQRAILYPFSIDTVSIPRYRHMLQGYELAHAVAPKGLGMEATGKNLNDLKLKKSNEDRIAQDNLEAAKELGEQIKASKVELSIKVGEGGRTFGSVSSKEIAEAVKDQMSLDIDKKKIQLKEPIKSLGTHIVSIKLHPKVTTELSVVVKEEV